MDAVVDPLLLTQGERSSTTVSQALTSPSVLSTSGILFWVCYHEKIVPANLNTTLDVIEINKVDSREHNKTVFLK